MQRTMDFTGAKDGAIPPQNAVAAWNNQASCFPRSLVKGPPALPQLSNCPPVDLAVGPQVWAMIQLQVGEGIILLQQAAPYSIALGPQIIHGVLTQLLHVAC